MTFVHHFPLKTLQNFPLKTPQYFVNICVLYCVANAELFHPRAIKDILAAAC